MVPHVANACLARSAGSTASARTAQRSRHRDQRAGGSSCGTVCRTPSAGGQHGGAGDVVSLYDPSASHAGHRAFIVAVPLRSQINVIIALCVYGIALIVRTATDAFRSVPEEVRTAAVAQGMSPSQIAWKVDMPLAIPVLISGLRVLCVSTVGLVTIGALIGVSSLGSLFTDGFQRNITAEVVVGIVAVVLLAVLFDVACLILQRLCTPWTRPGKAR